MKSVHGALALLALAATAPLAFAQSRTVPTDTSGRPVLDERGGRIVYRTAAAPLPDPNAAVAAKPTAAAAKTKTPRLALQSTGVSPSYNALWQTTYFGAGIGATGIHAVDADNDGRDELVLGGGSGFGGNAFWSIVDYAAARGEYDIVWQSPPYSSIGISALYVVQQGNTKRAWIGRSDGAIEVWNLLTRTRIDTLTPAAQELRDFAVADADNNGSVDVVAVTATSMFLYDPVTLGLRRTITEGAGQIAIGNVDADSRLEIVLNTGRVLDVVGASVTVQWNNSGEFGLRVALGDVDGDGMAELIASQGWQLIRAWDLDAQSLKWSVSTSHDIAVLHLIDVAGGATPEIIYGDGQWGQIHVLDAVTRNELWNLPNPEHGFTDIAVADSDGDGAREILWGAGYSHTGPDYLYVHDLATRAAEWRNTNFFGPFMANGIADLDGDGRQELVTISSGSDSISEKGLLMIFDAATDELLWRSATSMFDSFPVHAVNALKLTNVDADPQPEIVVATDRLYDGALYVIDGLTRARQNEAVFDSGSPLSVLDVADLTGDGRPEVIAGNNVAHTGSPGVFLYVLDPLTDAVVWRSASIASGFAAVTDIRAADVGAAGIDLIAASSNVHAVRWSDRRHLVSTSSGYLSVAAGDVAAAAGAEILAGRNNGTIDVLDGESLAAITSYNVCNSAIRSLQMHAPTRLILTCGSSLIVYDVDARTIVDETPTASLDLGGNGSLVTAVVDNRAMALAGGNHAIKFADLSANRLPVVQALTASVHWRGVRDVQFTATDADGDDLQFQLATLPSFGTATWLNATTGALRYTGGGVRTGTDALQVRATDGAQYSAPQELTIQLTNTRPLAQTAALSFHWRGAQTALLRAEDPESDPLTVSVTSPPQRGSLVINDAATGAITYTPSGAFVGTDAFSYLATDGADPSATVTTQVTLTNTTPTASGQQFDVSGSATVHARFNAQDPNQDPLTYSIVQQPTQGTLTVEAGTGLFQYVPRSGASGTDTVTFAASDGIAQAQATVQFRHPASSGGGGGGGGGNFGALMLLLLAPLARWRHWSAVRSGISVHCPPQSSTS
jgi:hypothetical protein